jgi:hypothetical protein
MPDKRTVIVEKGILKLLPSLIGMVGSVVSGNQMRKYESVITDLAKLIMMHT